VLKQEKGLWSKEICLGTAQQKLVAGPFEEDR